MVRFGVQFSLSGNTLTVTPWGVSLRWFQIQSSGQTDITKAVCSVTSTSEVTSWLSRILFCCLTGCHTLYSINKFSVFSPSIWEIQDHGASIRQELHDSSIRGATCRRALLHPPFLLKLPVWSRENPPWWSCLTLLFPRRVPPNTVNVWIGELPELGNTRKPQQSRCPPCVHGWLPPEPLSHFRKELSLQVACQVVCSVRLCWAKQWIQQAQLRY